MIQLLPFAPQHADTLLSYSLSEEQHQFTALPAQVFTRIAARNASSDYAARPVTILYQQQPAGFFVLDSGNDKFIYTDNPQSILLRSLSIDARLQGFGIGTAAMRQVPTYIQQHYAHEGFNEIVLGVNLGNHAAYRLYQKVGFTDTGRQITGLRGLQHVMYLKLQ
jgi:RimJ/RimL family protein N-acetyltransferase